MNHADEILSILREEIEQYDNRTRRAETGSVLEIGDGIATVYGLDRAVYGELIEFETGAQGMVLNLDKCLACHTCSIPCKNAWTTAPGTEYMWFNNVETKPGVGYPKEWENQDRYKGGWEIRDGKLHLRAGGKTDKLANIFANPDLPALDDYYEPWKYDYERLTDSPASRHQPVARPHSAVKNVSMH